MDNIKEFQGDHQFLSNFWPADVEFDGIIYPTVEHAYQAAKTIDLNEREWIRLSPTPGKAKRNSKQLTLRPDWDEVKIGIMTDLLYQKFTKHEDLKQKLLSTGDSIIQEGNAWGDTFWGVSDGGGMNMLGSILMEIRSKLKEG